MRHGCLSSIVGLAIVAGCVSAPIFRMSVNAPHDPTRFYLIPMVAWQDDKLMTKLADERSFRDFTVSDTPANIWSSEGNMVLLPVCNGVRDATKARIVTVTKDETVSISC